VYEVDLLTYPKCRGTMRVVSFIKGREVIKAILKYLALWLVNQAPFQRFMRGHYRMIGYVSTETVEKPFSIVNA
jgi:hypothetical protein